MILKLTEFNHFDVTQWVSALHGIYEHSPWIAERAWPERPFASLAALKHALQQQVTRASLDEQLGLIRAHPELAGKAALAGELTAESTHEQARAGLHLCSPDEYAKLQQLNADYNAKFGFPFIIAVKGPDGQGLTRQQIIFHFQRRLQASVSSEITECLHQIGRIAAMRLNALFGVEPVLGQQVLQRAAQLAAFSEQSDGLYCSYLRPAHRQCAAQLADWMRDAGLQVQIDVLGNVRGRYPAKAAASNAAWQVQEGDATDPRGNTAQTGALPQNFAAVTKTQTLIIGSHYDSVNNAGWYDGRLGILLPLALLQSQQPVLPFDVEIIAFAEEEGVRFPATFLGSRALAGQFDPALLAIRDADGITLAQALQDAGYAPEDALSDANLPATIAALALPPQAVLGFLEVHIEQGPVLLQNNLPLGVVTAINGSSRFWLHLQGQANHAGTTPMMMRQDALAGAAEIILALEQYCQRVPDLVGTVGQAQVPGGATNVVPGACSISVDIRAPGDATRLAARDALLQATDAICQRRGLQWQQQPILQVPAAPCDSQWQAGLQQALAQCGVPAMALPSGAGHDAMMMANLTPMAMLFVRCGNQGISHNPLETMNADDAELAAQVLHAWLLQIAALCRKNATIHPTLA